MLKRFRLSLAPLNALLNIVTRFHYRLMIKDLLFRVLFSSYVYLGRAGVDLHQLFLTKHISISLKLTLISICKQNKIK